MTEDQVAVLKAGISQHILKCAGVNRSFDFDNKSILTQVMMLKYDLDDLYDIANGFVKANALAEGVKLY